MESVNRCDVQQMALSYMQQTMESENHCDV
jgi:hypothetical protein